jgi:predicted phage terminase large subunit-like protein
MRWQAAKIESGLVSLPKEASWLAAFEDEVRQFPGGKHNDQVDSMSQALDHVTRRVPELILTTYRS